MNARTKNLLAKVFITGELPKRIHSSTWWQIYSRTYEVETGKFLFEGRTHQLTKRAVKEEALQEVYASKLFRTWKWIEAKGYKLVETSHYERGRFFWYFQHDEKVRRRIGLHEDGYSHQTLL